MRLSPLTYSAHLFQQDSNKEISCNILTSRNEFSVDTKCVMQYICVSFCVYFTDVCYKI